MNRKDRQGSSASERGGTSLLRRRCRLTVLLLSVLTPAFPGRVGAQTTVPPHLDYRTLHSEHVRVTFPPGMDDTARRIARRVDEVYPLLAGDFLPPPEGVIDILLTDHADIVNGTAVAVPSSRIVIWAQPPLDGMARSYFEDWIDSVVLHEMAHIFHFELAGPPGRILRDVFGRAPDAWPYFPATALPRLLIEGIGVYIESVHSSSGRIDGTSFESMLRAQWLEEDPERLDQAIGVSPLWPGGERQYVYGSLFLAYLLDRYGEAAVLHFLANVVDLWIPYRLDPPAREAFGRSMEELWEEWVAEVIREGEEFREEVGARGLGDEVELLTSTGGLALYPDAAEDGRVAFVRADARSDLQLRLWTPEGEHFVSRSNTGITPPRWTSGGEILFPQIEFLDPYQALQDLYRATVGGEVVRLTEGSRILHADPHPEGEGIVAVVAVGEWSRLVLLDRDGEEIRVLREVEPGVLWSHPAWSPDGTRIAVARRRPGGWTAIVLLAPDGTLLDEVTEDHSLNTVPAWGPDGESLVWGSDRSGISNLYGVRIGAEGEPGLPLQITDLTTGGMYPSIDPEGAWIYLSFLTGVGWEVGRIPYRPGSWFTPLPLDPRFEAPESDGSEPEGVASVAGIIPAASDLPGWELRPYSPLATLLPQYWLPMRREGVRSGDEKILPAIWGVEFSGADLVRRHEYTFNFLAPLRPPRERIEWGVRYSWSGLGNPILVLDSSRGWRFRGKAAVPGGLPGETLNALERESFTGAALEFYRRRMRATGILSIGGGHIASERSFRTAEGVESDRIALPLPRATFGEFRISAGWSTARAFPFSVSTESGVMATVAYRERHPISLPSTLAGVPGADGSFRELTGSLLGYLPINGPGYGRHVLALRVAAGGASGPGAGSGHFALGGASTFLPVRGYALGELFGESGWAASAEWRFPLGFLHRGVGAWPVYLDRLAGAVFLDLAGTEGAEGGGWERRGSLGGEVVLSHSLLFWNVERVAVGVAVPILGDERASVYLRKGWSF